MNIINKEQAKEKLYRPLTKSYLLPDEQWMLDNVISDMNRGNIDFALVKTDDQDGQIPKSSLVRSVEVWRRAPLS
jgi:hypothetical protein